MHYSGFNPFMSIDLPRCDESSGGYYVLFSQVRELVPRVVMESNTDDHPLDCEHILSMDMKFLTHYIGWLQMVVRPPGSRQYH
jgi:hypothetical protein